MAKRKTAPKPEQNDSRELFEALQLLEEERGISAEFLIDRIKKAIVTACKNTYGTEEVDVEIDPDVGRFEVYLHLNIVEEVEEPDHEILLETAREADPEAEIGGFVRRRLDTKQFGRVAAQTARNIIRQGIRDSEREQMRDEFKTRHQELVSALVERVDPKTGALSLRIGKAEAVLPKAEQIGSDEIREGDYVQVYVVDVRDTDKGPKAIISRTHPDLIRRLFEKEVPEIFDGTVEIKAIAREAGSRSKIAVLSHDPEVDAVGACIGARGARVSEVVSALGGEKIDIVEFSEDPQLFVAAALAPAKVLLVSPAADGSKVCRVTVPDAQLSLAIGNKGQNARLAAKLTGWKIDIRPESGFYGEEEPEAPAAQ